MCSISGTCGLAVTKFAVHLTWCRLQSKLDFDVLFRVTGVKMYESIFGTTKVAQVVTAVQRDL